MKRFYTILLFVSFMCISIHAQWIPWMRTPEDIVELGVKEKHNLIEQLKKEREQLNATKKSFAEELKKRSLDAERRLASVKEQLHQKPTSEFFGNEQSLLNEWQSLLKEESGAHDSILSRIDERINSLEGYLKDPKLDTFRRELVNNKADSLELVLELKKKVFDQTNLIKAIEEQQKNVALELDNRRRLMIATGEAYKKRKAELESGRGSTSQEPFGMNLRQKGELFVLEEKKNRDQTTLEELKIKELGHRQELLKSQLFLANYKLDILQEALANAKLSMMRMSEGEQAKVAYLKSELEGKQAQLEARKEIYQQEIDRNIVRQDELKELGKRLKISASDEIADWSLEPKRTVSAYTRLYEIGAFNEQLLLTKQIRDLLEARKNQEQQNFEYEKLQVESKETFSKISVKPYVSETAVSDETKNYQARRAKLETSKVQLKSLIDDLNPLIAKRKKALENIKERTKNLASLRDTLFKNSAKEYGTLIKRLHDSEDLIRRQIKLLDETHDTYEMTIGKIDESLQLIDFVIAELESNKLWYRPEQAIAWQDVHNFGPDLNRFFKELRAYSTHISARYFFETIGAGFAVPVSQLLHFLVILLALFALLIGFKKFAPVLNQKIIAASLAYRGLRTISLLFSLFSSFYCAYFIAISMWIMIYAIFSFFIFPDPYFYLFFYLLSIPYFLYLSNRFIRYLVKFNESRGGTIISQDFQTRFIAILSFLLYATTIIVLFREAFILVDYTKSNVPTMLLALNVILLQISIIFLFNKDSFLRMIPTTRSYVWEWAYKQVDSYYFAIVAGLIAIIVLVNPYIGYGRLLLYVVARIAYTIAAVYLLFWLHDILKRISTRLFFQTKDDTVRERFVYAKTWYGLFVIATLLTMIAIAIVIIAKLWHWPQGLANIAQWEDVKSWIASPFLLKDTDYPISFYSLFKLVFFFVGGLLVAFAVDKFVLDRIFDVLFVEPGVQHAVSSVTRYLIVIIAVIAGFHTLNLGQHLWYFILAAGAGLGFVVKDPLFDLISYFIILIQRPVKVGDYIRFDEDIRGVVRRITPRTVVLRRRNSTTIVVPNSQIMSKSFSNWNYSRGFTAFDDIYLTVDYAEDPAKVKEILNNAVRANQYILKSPSPIIRLFRFGAYGYVFQVRGFISTNYTLDMWDIASDIRLGISKAFRDQGIKVAGIKAPDMLPGMTMGGQSGTPAEFQEHRTSDE